MQSVTQLSSIGFETAEITIRKGKAGKPDQTIQIRGLSTKDLVKLMRVHGPSMVMLFERTLANKLHEDKLAYDMAVAKGADPNAVEETPLDLGPIILQLVEQFPDLIADLVVLVSDDPNPNEAFKVAQRLPVPVQLKLLQEVSRLTLEDHGGLGELIETVTGLFGGINGLMSTLRASAAGSIQSSTPSAT